MQCLLHYFTTRHICYPDGVLGLCSFYFSMCSSVISKLYFKMQIKLNLFKHVEIISVYEMQHRLYLHYNAIPYIVAIVLLVNFMQPTPSDFSPRKFCKISFPTVHWREHCWWARRPLCTQTAATSRPQRHTSHHVRTWTWIPFHSSEATPATHTGAGSSLWAAWMRDVIARVLIDLERRCCLQRLSHSALWCQAHMEDSAKDFSHLASPPSTDLGFPL